MATLGRCLRLNLTKLSAPRRYLSVSSKYIKRRNVGVFGGSIAGVAVGVYWLNKVRNPGISPALAKVSLTDLSKLTSKLGDTTTNS